MDPVTWRRVRELFEQLESVPADQHDAWIEAECQGEPDVRRELERLQSAKGSPTEWLSPPGGDVGWLSPEPSAPLKPGTRFGPYQLISFIGFGGMGAVYCAEQEQPRRLVALKTLRAELSDADLLRRFRAEAEILGHLRHPGIAQIYDAGTQEFGSQDDGGVSLVPYLVMEFVEDALGLVEYAERAALTQRQRLEIFLAVCEAVHHGHQKGVIHRDLKPANLLVDGEGRPKVIDFGLARPLDPGAFEFSFVQTRSGEILGTLPYMSPEHVSADSYAIDTRSDVYSLGCILCELLTGAPPHDLAGMPLPSAVRHIAEEPAKIGGRVSGDLRWIVERALAQEPERRYGSASELAADIRRFLLAEPIAAGPPSAFYRLSRMARRHRAMIFGAAAVIVGLSVGLLRARDEAENAQRQATVSRIVSIFLTDLFEGAHAYRGGEEARVIDAIELGERKLSTLKDPIARAILTGIVGKGFLELDRRKQAEPLITESVQALRQLVEPDDLHRLRTETIYADLLEQKGLVEESRVLSEELLPRMERVLGSAHDQTRYLRNNLVICSKATGHFDRAEELCLVNLKIVEQSPALGPRSIVYMRLLHRLGNVQERQGKLAEARDSIAAALELARTVDGVAPLHQATFLMDLTGVLRNMGDETAAIKNYRDVERLYEAHNATVSNRFALAQNFGWCLLDNGELAEAALRQERASAMVLKNWKEPGFRLSENLRLKAAVLSAQGEHRLAEAAGIEALGMVAESLAAGAPWPALCHETLVRVWIAGGRASEAHESGSIALAAVAKALGDSHPLTLALLRTCTEAAVAAKKRQDAIALAGDLLQRAKSDESLLEEGRALLKQAESLPKSDD